MTYEKHFFIKYPHKFYKKGDVIIKPDDHLKQIYYLVKGNVKQYFKSSSGEVVVVHVYSKGAFFPIALILSNKKNRYFFVAVSNVKVHVAESKDVIRWLRKEPSILLELTGRLARGLDGMVTRLEGALEKDLHDRLLSLIRYFSGRFTKKGKIRKHIKIPLSHQELASWMGVSRETVTRAMIRLEKEGELTYKYRRVTLLKQNNNSFAAKKSAASN
jgi:CRP/FNR family transcriptional regulator, anaerobic regulatory protein